MSRTASGAGDAVQLVAIVWMATSSAEPGRKIALIGLCYLLPAALFGPVAGMLADRMNRCALAVLCDTVRIVCTLMLVPALAVLGFIGLLAVLFIYACASLTFTVSLSSALPDWVPGGALLRTNSLLATSGYIAAIVGSSVGGILLTMSGRVPFFANSVLLFASALSLFVLRLGTQRCPVPLDETESRSSFKEVLGYVFFDRRLRLLVILSTCAVVSFAPSLAALAVLVNVELHGTSTDYGLVQAGTTAGLAAGAVVVALAGRRTKSQMQTVGVSYVLMGVMTILLSRVATITGAVLLVVLRSGANSAGSVMLQTMVQQRTTSRLRGRVLSVFGSFQEGARGAVLPLAGWLVDLVGPRLVLLAMGLALLLPGGIAVLTGRTRRDLDRRRETSMGGSS
ncbi:MAG: MFS transporter [Pseudonocardia sp.]|nr:MFS transporter [Pseudonocardia sp.]